MKQRQIAAMCSIVIGMSAGNAILNHYCTGGYKIIVEGKTIGYVTDSADYEKALSEVNETICADFGDEYILTPDAKMQSIIMDKNMISTQAELHDSIARLSGYMTDGYVLVLGGEELCNFKTEDAANEALSLLCDRFSQEGGESSIREDYELIQKQISAVGIMSPESAAEYLAEQGKLHVKTTVNSVYYTTKDFETTEKPDDKLVRGSKRVIQEGSVGEYLVTAVIEYTDGVQVAKSIISETLVSEPVDEIIAVGTREVPNMGSGSFIMPTKGVITSGFGARWGRNHNGIDIAAPIGSSINASDSGVVIFAGYKGSYGNLVKIDHKNGYVTYYAHCSEILVSEGEAVSQGQLIAKVGSTGNSTGPHCHFEVQTDGVAQNPLNYVG